MDRSQPNTAGMGGEKISGGAKYLSSFLKFEIRNNKLDLIFLKGN